MRKQEFNSKLISLLPRSPRFPFTYRFAARAPCDSKGSESIEPRPPRPCEVGRPKGRRRKNRRQSHKFFFSTCCASTRWSPGESPAPPPLPHRSHRTPPGFRCRTRQLRRRGESPRARCDAGLALHVPARRVACIVEVMGGDATRMTEGGLGVWFICK